MMSSDGLDRQLPVLLDELASPRVLTTSTTSSG